VHFPRSWDAAQDEAVIDGIVEHSLAADALGFKSAFWDKVNAEGRKIVEAQKGTEIFDLSEAEMARWAKAAEPVIENWIKETPNGAQVLAEFRARRDRAASM
jgi:hypothetical protein